ncbi:acyl carrier protein [Pelagibius litoralis]|uniref:Acyl carrier protein n=1 Tax=Pelagibius litoralis TaxID=374515 RepID=A0A967EXA5_9PROT|nr:acyl carrier protein [Pelagibius litoralis]NIA68540.1 acyl carrier protein [Pelagibius litoralis]
MTPDEARGVFFEELGNIAPEWDPAEIDPQEDIRDAMDIDSMDLLNLVIALHKRLGLDIPESDYGELVTIDGAIAYLAAKSSG